MRISRHPDVAKDLKALKKKRRSVETDITGFEKLLASGANPPGYAWANFPLQRDGKPAAVIKHPVVAPGENMGRSQGYRYICERLVHEGEEWCCCFGVYVHTGVKQEESNVRKLILQRFQDFEVFWELEYNECTPIEE